MDASIDKAWLYLKSGLSVQIQALDPDSIKRQVKESRWGREGDAQHLTVLNFVAKALGSAEGIAGYQRVFWPQVLKFLEKHDLRKRQDLISVDPFDVSGL